jgi:hypothetical protein
MLKKAAICHSEGDIYPERIARRVRPRNLLLPWICVKSRFLAPLGMTHECLFSILPRKFSTEETTHGEQEHGKPNGW